MLNRKNKKLEYTQNDFEFMNSLSAAMLEKTPSKVSKTVKIWFFSVMAFIVWASFAYIDEITRGDGKVIPYGQNKIVQNLEGGIVKSILVQEGKLVKEGDIILTINNTDSVANSGTNEASHDELVAKKARLYAEANSLPFSGVGAGGDELRHQMEMQRNLYNSNRQEQASKDSSLQNLIEQKKQAHKEASEKVNSLKKSLAYVTEEVQMTAPMVKEGIKSKVDFLKLQREATNIENEIEATKLSLPRLLEEISEYKNRREETRLLFINKARTELSEVSAELSRLDSKQIKFSDQVDRTVVRSPVDGVVQKLFINTIGGVIKPGADIVEIVPSHEKLYLEVKIKPSDIAFIHPGAEAKVKVSAYDFAIHGGLTGKVVNISPDTITDKKENTFYIINVMTDKNYLGTKEHPLKIIPGMTVNVDIVTGEKSVMQYILKPILKSKQYIFTER